MIPSFTYRIREILWGAVQASVISKKQILSLFAFLCFINLSIAQTTQTFSSSGTWQAPAGVTTLKVECWGGGGRGGSTVLSGNETGGGGGGAYARLNAYGVANGTTYTITVGAGSTTTAAGGDSWFNSNSTVLAKGGNSANDNATGGANGGSSAASIGDVKFAGGNGANGSNNNYGGGGGSSAGIGAAGANGSTSNGGSAPSGGGNGGNGRTGSNGGGFDGTVPGGGGGGVRSGTFGFQTGGDGANGRVILTWTCPTYNLSSTSVAASVCIGSAASISLTSSAAGLPAGTYTVTYSLSGANSGTGLTASMTVSSAGTGSFSTGVLANSGSTTITITQLSSGAGAAICNSSITANNTATISVGVVNAGSISGTQSTCFGGDPTLISNSVSGSGAGTITYTWESSTTSATAGFSSISGATADSYDPPAGLSATTWYRRITISTDGAAVCQATSNAIQVTVSTTQLPTISAASSSSLTCAGGPFNLFANTNAEYSATVSPALAIPDANATGVNSIITTSGLPTSLTGWKVIVTVNITHTWTSDIELFLARPGGGFGSGNATNHVGTIAGQSIRLSNDNGGSGDGYANCTFRDDAATNVTTQSGNVTISGNYIPEELLSTLSGNPNGNWTLRVSDDAADDTGTLTSWTLQIVYPNGLSYSWSSTPSGFTSSVQNPTGVSANENTTYTVVQTDLNTGCTQSSSVTVNTIANPAPKVIPGDSVLCSGTDLYVHVIDTGAYSGGYPVGSLLEWVNIVANQNVLDSLNVNGNGSIYQAIITTPDGCTGISPVRTIISKSILPNETITHATCNLPNGKIVTNMVMGTAPFHYVWKSGSIVLKDTVSSSPLDSILNLATGSYTLEISDNFGNVNPLEPSCSSIVFTYTVNEIAPPSVNVTGTDISCFGMNDGQATATPGLGTAPYSYLWSNSETTQSIINLGPGTYTVTVTDVTGCSSEGQITIIEPSEIIISLNYTEPLCTGSLTGVVYSNVSGGTLPYNYEWFDSGFLPEGLNDDTLLNVGADTYFLVITDANGCIASNSILVEDPPLLTATCSATPATCFGGGDGTVSLLSSGGRGFHTYLWSTGDVTTSVTGLEAGTYTATVTDGNGCTAICTAVVSQPDVVSGIVTGSDVNCINDQTSVVVTATGGTGPYTGEGTFTVGVGTHTFPLTDINGCTGSASITINHLDVDAPVISDCPSDITQCGDIATWVSPTAIDNCTLVSFTSDFNSGASFPVGTTLVTYTATDNAGLVSTCSFNVTILPTPIWYADADGDGFGNPAISLVDCIQPVGYISDNTDCDDSQILYADNDGDLFGAGSPAACGVPVNGDCDDNNAAVNPAATEVCNSIDDDCDGLTDEGVLLTFYADTDADSYGNAALSTQACSAPVGYVADNTDCDDNNAAVNPAAVEICNAIDDDCNGLTDDGLVFLNYYVDGDNDGFGAGVATSSCNPIAGSVLVDGDCDDNNAAVNPAATEVCNGIDDDCDGLTEEGLTFLNYYVDGDNDGFGAGAATSSCNPIAGSVLVDGDCDDNNAAVNPAATEVCNGIDDDCDGLTEEGLTFLDYYVDGDNDGFGAGTATSSCNPIAGSVLVDGDCDDNNAAVNPAATEVCNGIDDDCDGLTEEGLTFLNYYVDGDNDGFGAGVATSSCAPIAGSVLVDGDCDDNNAAVNPAAVEICNAIDDDCNGLTDDGLVFLNYYVDGDNDGFGAGTATSSCAPIAGSVLVDGDCDDNNAAVNPAATEVCNSIDDDCDGSTDEGVLSTFYADADADSYGNAAVSTQACSAPVGYVADNTDCDDNNAAVNPAAVEICNSIDDDCNGLTDDGLVFLNYYVDADNDGFGAGAATSSCAPIAGSVLVDGDCDDNNGAINPGTAETCNNVDDNCNGLTDDGLVFLDYFTDADNDGFGTGAATSSCAPIAGSVLVDGDCDDNNAAVNPAAVEICNSIDDDCNGLTDDGLVFLNYYVDGDNDGFGAGAATSSCAPIAGSVLVDGDCDDNNAAVNPAATEICNSIDDDCDGSTDEGVLLTFYADADADSYGNAAVSAQACSAPVGYVADNTDCDDNNAAVNPAAVEICNSIDDDCNGLTDDGLVFLNYYVDADNDGFGAGAATSSCAPIAGSVLVDGDCDDNNAAVNPAAVEICNAIDDDCNGLTDDGLVFLDYYVDGDNDGFGAGAATSSCNPIAGSVLVDGDCDDNNAAVNPAATEVCNGIDDDCDGLTEEGLTFLNYYVDGDNDGFGAGVATSSCAPIAGSVLVDGDCDDNNAAVNPAAVEICNSIDDDCNGLTDDGLVFLNYYVDGDNDGFGAGVATSSCAPIAGSVLVDGDCDDNNSAVNPAAVEICNAIDDDCNGLTDDGLVFLNYYVDGDNDGFGAGAATSSCAPIAGSVLVDGDCDDNNAAVNPAATEVCNSIDDDCDGSTDEGVLLTFYADADADSYGNAAVSAQACSAPVGYVADNTDCDDNNAAVNPAATEICNSIDDDCDGSTDEGVLLTFYADADADSYGNAAVSAQACSAPVGYVADNTDCDDSNLNINPGATEVCGNSIDDNCDTNIDEGCILYTYFADTDNDSYGDPLNSVSNYVSIPPVGYVADNTDCDDNNATVNPAAVEICNAIDDDCNGLTDDGLVFLNYYVDGDNDGFGAGAATSSCAPIAGSVLVDGDCDDNNAAVNPAAVEICNSIDDDCDGSTDEGVLLTFYADADADSYGNAAVSTQACSAPVGYVADNTDCDDNNAAVNPAAVEICNAIDDDCNGLTDDGLVFLNYYVDGDNDGFGAGAATSSCAPIAGSVLVDGDCDDNNAAVNPAATEICNSIDDDCDGSTDEGVLLTFYADADADSYGNAAVSAQACSAPVGFVADNTDCDDNNAAVNPAAVEICNSIDDDCNGLTDDGLVFLNYYVDGDNDGFGAGAATSSCAPIAGSVLVDGDCDDNNAAVNPAATEICNSIDDDCDGSTDEGVLLTFYADADADSYGNAAVSAQACSAPIGYVADNTDCDDNNAAVNPAAVEICNAIDDDCNGLTDDGLVFLNYYVDGDNDGFGAGAATSSCAPIAGSVLVDGDCDDNNAAVNPAATEVCNSIDDDCDGSTDEGVLLTFYADADADSYGNATVSAQACSAPVGYVADNTDCDDNNAAVNPAAVEICNSIDDDCNGLTDDGLVFLNYYVDGDNDGFGAGAATSSCAPIAGSVLVDGDCDDNNAAVNPAAVETCNAIDDDCNGLTDDGLVFLNYYVDGDNDGFGAGAATSSCAPIAGSVLVDGDCDDNNAAVNPAAVEICNAIDDDCNGLTDDGLVFLNYYVDGDNDGFGAGAATSSCAPIAGSVLVDGDCDDNNAAVNPAATEICNSIDDDCDGSTDEGVLLTFYADADADSYGNAAVSAQACSAPVGYVADNTDCDDNNAAVNPAAVEICNSIDDDCNGLTDDGLVFLNYYVDGDNDGFGAGAATSSCAPIAGSVLVDGDCDDNNGAINPGAAETCNNVDDNCNGLTDDGLVFLDYFTDADNDGFGTGAATSSCAPIAGSVLVDGDCDDNNAAVNPAAVEICNAIDDDCNGLTDDGLVFLNYYVDGDNDGFGAGAATSSCAPIAGSVLVDGDCDDNNAAVNPAATEICNSIDDDCDGSTDEGVLLTFYADADTDSYGNAAVSAQACSAPVGYVADNTDCDDNNAAVNPAAVEICNSIDDDCNGLTDDGLVFLNYYVDGDNDGFGAGVATSSCAPIAGSVLVDGDCDDNNGAINPGAAETCNNVDDNCNGLTDDGLVFLDYFTDADNDGFGTGAAISSCTPVSGAVLAEGDCDDNNNAVHPGATELCNGIDDDCDGLTDDNVFVPLGNISGPAQQCVPATFSFATFSIAAPAGANFYNWTVPNGMSIYAGQGTNSVLVTWTGPAVHAGISGPMTVTVGTVCGGIAVATVDIDINYTNPVLPPSISGPSKVCPGDVVTYSVSNVARAKTYNWTVPAGLSIISGQGTNVITASVSGGYSGGSISVFASNFCGNGPARNKTITFNTPLIPAPIVGQASGLCGATNISFTTAGSANASGYNWTVPAGVSIVSGQGSNTILVDVVSGFVSGSITVTGVNGCGTGSTRSLSIIGAPGQAAPITGPTAICPGATNIIYEVPTIAGATNYTWTVPGSATIISGQGTKQITVNYNALQTSNQVITVRASNGCGLGAIRSLSGISINSVNCGGPRQSLAMLKDVIAYPNPATDVVNIQFYSEESDKYIVRILDLSGRTIYMEEGFSNTGENSQQLNVADLASGIYYVELTSAGQTEKIKLMVE